MGRRGGFYAVAVGRSVGVYEDWWKAREQVLHFSHGRYKWFPTLAQANEFIRVYKNAGDDTEPRSALMGREDGYYAVASGNNIGVYNRYCDAKIAVEGYAMPRWKWFATLPEAEAYIEEQDVGWPRKRGRDSYAYDDDESSDDECEYDIDRDEKRRLVEKWNYDGGSPVRTRYVVARGQFLGVFDRREDADGYCQGLGNADVRTFYTAHATHAFCEGYRQAVRDGGVTRDDFVSADPFLPDDSEEEEEESDDEYY